MILKRYSITVAVVLAVIAIAAAGVSIVHRQLSSKRTALGHMVRFWKGEHYPDQYANDLADDLRHSLALAQIQPWAVETMARFRAGQVRTNGGNQLFWVDKGATLAPEETPEFIKKHLGEKDKQGHMWPVVEIVLSNGQPDYIVLVWGYWGIAVGSPEYRLSFSAAGTNEIAPGVYVYSHTK
jgi:hypothetical protein